MLARIARRAMQRVESARSFALALHWFEAKNSLRHARCEMDAMNAARTQTSKHAYEACMNPQHLQRTLIDGRHDARNSLQPVRPA
jgi:hypothetical protein